MCVEIPDSSSGTTGRTQVSCGSLDIALGTFIDRDAGPPPKAAFTELASSGSIFTLVTRVSGVEQEGLMRWLASQCLAS
jgi:hypothetical protein